MSLHQLLLRMWEFLYPPYELSRCGTTGDSRSDDPSAISHYGKKSVAPDVQQSHLAVAEAIYKSEIDRKKSIEDKAATFLTGVAISSGILIALPALLTERIGGPLYLKVTVLIVFIIAVGYLVIAAIYSVKVRARAAHFVINSASLQTFTLTAPDFRRQWALHLIDLVRRNEPLLLLKANQLYLAERTFLRGVVVASFGGFLLGIFAIAYPKLQSSPSRPVDSVDGRDIMVLATSLVRCVNSSTSLGMQLTGKGKALGEIQAELAATLKAQAEMKAKLEAKKKTTRRHSSAPPHPAPLKPVMRECSPDSVPNGHPAPDKSD